MLQKFVDIAAELRRVEAEKKKQAEERWEMEKEEEKKQQNEILQVGTPSSAHLLAPRAREKVGARSSRFCDFRKL